jgi:uncharacterized phiE125 gp8 family phage protein
MKILGDGLVPEAVTVPEFKAAVPMAEADEFDASLTMILRAATQAVEEGARRPILPRPVEILPPVTSEGWCRFWFPVAPVQAVTAVQIWNEATGLWVTLPGTDWSLDMAHDEPQLVLVEAVRQVYGAAAVKLQATVGSTVPDDRLRQAVILIAQEWHLAGAGMGDVAPEVRSFAAHALIRQTRYRRPKVVA